MCSRIVGSPWAHIIVLRQIQQELKVGKVLCVESIDRCMLS